MRQRTQLALVFPDDKLRPIWSSDQLLGASSALPTIGEVNARIRPVDSAYLNLLREAEPEKKLRAAFALAELSWKTFLYRWELQHRSGERTTLSGEGIDLYKQCRSLL